MMCLRHLMLMFLTVTPLTFTGNASSVSSHECAAAVHCADRGFQGHPWKPVSLGEVVLTWHVCLAVVRGTWPVSGSDVLSSSCRERNGLLQSGEPSGSSSAPAACTPVMLTRATRLRPSFLHIDRHAPWNTGSCLAPDTCIPISR